IYSVHEFTICVIETIGFENADGGNDVIYGTPNADILFGGGGDDVIYGGGGNDLIFGDQGKVSCANGHTYNPDDPLNGVCPGLGIDGDLIDGGTGNDLIAGDNAECCRRPAGDELDPRMRALIGTTLYGTSIPDGTDGQALVTGASQNNPTRDQEYVIVLLDHS